MRISSTRRRGGAACTALLVLAGCVAHPVGPARDLDDFRGKASTTVESALSAVQTVRLLVDTAIDGDALGAYTKVAVSEQEDALGGVRGTFMSIQPPPGTEATDLRGQVSRALTSAFDHVSAARIEVRRGDLDQLDAPLAALAADAEALEDLVDQLS